MSVQTEYEATFRECRNGAPLKEDCPPFRICGIERARRRIRGVLERSRWAGT